MFFLPALLSAAGSVASGVGAAAGALGSAGAAGLGALGSAGLAGLGAGGNIIGSGLAAGAKGASALIGEGSKFLMGSQPAAGLAGPPQQGFLAKTLGSAGAKKVGGAMVDTFIASSLANAMAPSPPRPRAQSQGSSYSPGFNVQASPYQSPQGSPSQSPQKGPSPRSGVNSYRPNYDRVNQSMRKKYGRKFFV